MKYYVEERLSNFSFWSGAKENANLFTSDELDDIGDALDDMYDGDISDEQINDLFWFEPESVAEMIGLAWDDNKCRPVRPMDEDEYQEYKSHVAEKINDAFWHSSDDSRTDIEDGFFLTKSYDPEEKSLTLYLMCGKLHYTEVSLDEDMDGDDVDIILDEFADEVTEIVYG